MRSGWLCLDKPDGMSSNLAMVRVRNFLHEKTGYVGTLDPFATGVLPIAIGEARKFIRFIDESEKKYVFTVKFGEVTDSLDRTGKIIKTTRYIPNKNDILGVLKNFCGVIKQIPPIFSAIKINGTRSCDIIRSGKNVTLKYRDVKITSFHLISDDIVNNEATFEVVCSKGTYIRSLVRDIAEKLGSLAYTKTLRRIKSGFFSISNAISLEKLLKIKDTDKISCILTSVESPLDDIPALYLDGGNIAKLRNGLGISLENSAVVSSNVRIFDDACGVFCGVGAVSVACVVKPIRMCIGDLYIGEKDVDNKQTGNY